MNANTINKKIVRVLLENDFLRLENFKDFLKSEYIDQSKLNDAIKTSIDDILTEKNDKEQGNKFKNFKETAKKANGAKVLYNNDLAQATKPNADIALLMIPFTDEQAIKFYGMLGQQRELIFYKQGDNNFKDLNGQTIQRNYICLKILGNEQTVIERLKKAFLNWKPTGFGIGKCKKDKQAIFQELLEEYNNLSNT